MTAGWAAASGTHHRQPSASTHLQVHCRQAGVGGPPAAGSAGRLAGRRNITAAAGFDHVSAGLRWQDRAVQLSPVSQLLRQCDYRLCGSPAADGSGLCRMRSNEEPVGL
jgi:hypothetical protein